MKGKRSLFAFVLSLAIALSLASGAVGSLSADASQTLTPASFAASTNLVTPYGEGVLYGGIAASTDNVGADSATNVYPDDWGQKLGKAADGTYTTVKNDWTDRLTEGATVAHPIPTALDAVATEKKNGLSYYYSFDVTAKEKNEWGGAGILLGFNGVVNANGDRTPVGLYFTEGGTFACTNDSNEAAITITGQVDPSSFVSDGEYVPFALEVIVAGGSITVYLNGVQAASGALPTENFEFVPAFGAVVKNYRAEFKNPVFKVLEESELSSIPAFSLAYSQRDNLISHAEGTMFSSRAAIGKDNTDGYPDEWGIRLKKQAGTKYAVSNNAGEDYTINSAFVAYPMTTLLDKFAGTIYLSDNTQATKDDLNLFYSADITIKSFDANTYGGAGILLGFGADKSSVTLCGMGNPSNQLVLTGTSSFEENQIAPSAPTHSPKNMDVGSQFSIAVQLKGLTARVWLNGADCGSVTLPEGFVPSFGLAAKNIGAEFDNVRFGIFEELKDPFVVDLKKGNGYKFTDTLGSVITSLAAYSGDSVSFKVAVDAGLAAPVVRVGGTVLTAVGGVYTVANVTANATVTVAIPAPDLSAMTNLAADIVGFQDCYEVGGSSNQPYPQSNGVNVGKTADGKFTQVDNYGKPFAISGVNAAAYLPTSKNIGAVTEYYVGAKITPKTRGDWGGYGLTIGKAEDGSPIVVWACPEIQGGDNVFVAYGFNTAEDSNSEYRAVIGNFDTAIDTAFTMTVHVKDGAVSVYLDGRFIGAASIAATGDFTPKLGTNMKNYRADYEDLFFKTTATDLAAAEYKISCVSGSVEIGTITYTFGQTVALDPIEKKGYSFEGWHLQSALGDAVITEIAGTIGGNFAIYCEYKLVTYTIRYFDGAAELVKPELDKTYNYRTYVELKAAEKDGYTFLGWFETEDFSGEAVTEIPTGQVGNKTFYAKYQKDEKAKGGGCGAGMIGGGSGTGMGLLMLAGVAMLLVIAGKGKKAKEGGVQ